MSIQDLDEGFNEGLEKLQTRREGFIRAGVYIGEGMSLRRSLSRGSTTELLNIGLYT